MFRWWKIHKNPTNEKKERKVQENRTNKNFFSFFLIKTKKSTFNVSKHFWEHQKIFFSFHLICWDDWKYFHLWCDCFYFIISFEIAQIFHINFLVWWLTVMITWYTRRHEICTSSNCKALNFSCDTFSSVFVTFFMLCPHTLKSMKTIFFLVLNVEEKLRNFFKSFLWLIKQQKAKAIKDWTIFYVSELLNFDVFLMQTIFLCENITMTFSYSRHGPSSIINKNWLLTSRQVEKKNQMMRSWKFLSIAEKF